MEAALQAKLVMYVPSQKVRRYRLRLSRRAFSAASGEDMLQRMQQAGWEVLPSSSSPPPLQYKKCSRCRHSRCRRDFARRQWSKSELPVCLECAATKAAEEIREARALREAAAASFVPPPPRSDSRIRRELHPCVGSVRVRESPDGRVVSGYAGLALGCKIVASMAEGFQLVEYARSGRWVRVSPDGDPPRWLPLEKTVTYTEKVKCEAHARVAARAAQISNWHVNADSMQVYLMPDASSVKYSCVSKGTLVREYERREGPCSAITWLRISDDSDPQTRWLLWLHAKDLRFSGLGC